MSNRTFYATDDNNELIVAFQRNYGLSPSQAKIIKDHCTRIFIDSMGNDAPSDWSFSNQNMKKWLATEYGIKLPLLVINEKYEDDLYDGITNALDPQTATKKFSKSKCVYGKKMSSKQFARITVDLSDSDRYRLYDAFVCYLHQPYIDKGDREDILAVAEKLIPNLVSQLKK